jgi:hypothetical protein
MSSRSRISAQGLEGALFFKGITDLIEGAFFFKSMLGSPSEGSADSPLDLWYFQN